VTYEALGMGTHRLRLNFSAPHAFAVTGTAAPMNSEKPVVHHFTTDRCGCHSQWKNVLRSRPAAEY